MAEANKRQYWIDNIRAIAIILVVIGHSIILYSSSWSIYKTNISAPYFDILKRIINVIQMPLFFALAGYLFYTTMRKRTLKTIFIDKLKRLMIPFLIFSFFWLLPIRLLIKYPNYQNQNLLKDIIVKKILLGADNGHLWYLPTLFLCFISYSIIIMIEEKLFNRKNRFLNRWGGKYKKHYLNLFLGVMAYVAQIVLNMPQYIEYLAQYFFWFSLGVLIREKNFECRSEEYRIVMSILCLCSTIIYLCYPNLLLINISSVLWVLTFFSIRFNKNNKLLAIISENSFGIYLFHSPLVYITYTYCSNSIPILVFTLNFFVWGGFSLLFSVLLRKSKLKIVLGE